MYDGWEIMNMTGIIRFASGTTHGLGASGPFHGMKVNRNVLLELPTQRNDCALCVRVAERQILEANSRAAHERRIALALQKTLLPDKWTSPGLEIATCYQAGSVESLIGGDFYDVFELKPGVSAFVVGDVCGKGLQAAAHISTISQMLRYALYSSPSPREAVSELNEIVSTHHLLPSFATLFVGVFESASRTLRYVSCGHEPALLVRAGASPTVSLLNPTGPILGVFKDGAFEETSLILQKGDGVVVYTDGLVECGPARSDQLTEGRLMDVLRKNYAGPQRGPGGARALRDGERSRWEVVPRRHLSARRDRRRVAGVSMGTSCRRVTGASIAPRRY